MPFFVVFTTAWTFLGATIAAIAARALPWRERRWIVAFAVGALVVSVLLIAWMAPLIWGLILHKYSTPEQATAQFRLWERANLIRLVAEFLLLLVGLRALIGVHVSASGERGRRAGA